MSSERQAVTAIADDIFARQLCRHLGFVLIGVDTDLRIRSHNDQATGHFGADGKSLVGKLILDLIQQSERDGAEALLRAAIADQTVGDMEIKYDRGEGKKATLVFIVSPIADEGGVAIGASVAMRDISQRKRMSQELARARRMAALGKMAQGVTHHFNNILGGMLTSIDYVLPSDSPRELRRTLRVLAQAIGRATRITQQLEAFAESRHQSPEWADLNELMARFVARLDRQAQHQEISLETRIDRIPSREFEVQRVMPVLESITQNAFDAMSPGQSLAVTMVKEADRAVITIQDGGCGIPDEVMDRIFEPFFTTKGELAGGVSNNPGLGLAAVHGLVAEIGGTIEVSSTVGKGTTVVVRLPLQEQAPDRHSTAPPPAAEAS